jgi:hypothetical protein
MIRAEGRLCVRFYRRRDGTILTNNCPVGLRALKRRASKVASATLSAVVSFFAGLGVMSGVDLSRSLMSEETIGNTVEDTAIMGTMTVEPVTPSTDVPEMGNAVVNDSGWVSGRLVQIDIAKPSRHQRAGARRE